MRNPFYNYKNVLLKSCLWFSLAVLSTAILSTAILSIARADTLIGGDSLAVECYVASQAAVLNGSSSRASLAVCTRAIEDANLSTINLVGSYVNRGVILMAMNKPNDALKDIERALRLDKDTGEAYLNRGNLWFAAGELEKAAQDYDLAIKLGVRQQHVAYLNRGIARESLGYLSAAQRDYSAALEIQNDWTEALSRLERVTRSIQQELRKRESANNKKAS